MSRLPIRLRLTLAFAAAMALVLTATGAFLHARLGASLDEAIDEGLATRTAELTPVVRTSNTVARPAPAEPDESFVQVLDRDGRIVFESPRLGEAVLPASALSRTVSTRTQHVVIEDTPGPAGRTRARVTRVETARGTRILVVGSSLEDRDETVRGFLVLLLVVGPAALVLTSLLGYGLATAALRPVEAMRAEAAVVSASEPGRRLPLPRAQDEILRLGETLNRMLERLESALERERTFVADAGHELRTPLALLKAELELALRRPRTADELEEALRSAAVEADRLAGLAEDLLLLAGSDQGRLVVRREPVRAGDLLRRVADRFALRAEAQGRRLAVDAPDTLEVDVDPLRLEQALGNLVANALEHGAGPISLSAHDHDGRVELHVRDQGGGFSEQLLPHAFERFTRADDARSAGGTGLGLTIVNAIAKAHGGSAHAANADGGGADVWLSLPPRSTTGELG